jgi:hypothetical protein
MKWPRKAASHVWTWTVAAALAMVMIGAGATGAQASSPAWAVMRSPDATLPGGNIHSVSCSAPKACTAVGTNLDTSGIDVTLAERWDGTSWQRQATPNPPGNTDPSATPDLLGVSCPAAGFCAAVGEYQSLGGGQVSMAETWNGSAWTWQPVPVAPGSAGGGLTAVSCTSPRFCEAVGFNVDVTDGTQVTLAATWNGTSWSLQQAPNPGGFGFVQFTTVSCASPAFCEAWGSRDTGVPLAEQWDGSSWQPQSVPSDAAMKSVSCASATFCEAVGSGAAYTWNGSAWTAQTIPAPAATGTLGGVSCASVTFCEAVGEYFNANAAGVAAVWNGSAWSAQAIPEPAGATFTNLNAVSCVSPSSCEAGGRFDIDVTANDPMPLAEAWNGAAWQLQHAVAPPGATYNTLTGVSCVSATFCEAVGAHFDNTGTQVSLMEMWNGRSWRIQAGPQKALSVSCVSPRFCEAVGAGPFAEIWNGTSWQVQARPGAAAVETQVVSCATAGFCMSADGFANIDIWNGSSWSAGPAVPGFRVTSISCLSASFCEVVGEGPSGQNAAVWNGTSWTGQATPGPSSASFNAVSCTTASSCVATGQIADQNGQLSALAESWDGSAWTIQPAPDPAVAKGSVLNAVSCTSATSCTAVGQYNSGDVTNYGALQTLVEVWDGMTWSLRSAPDPSPAHDVLTGVSCGTSQECTAVGQAADAGGVESTLIETGD